MSGNGTEAATIKTRIPSRLDRLPWARFHWMAVIGLSRRVGGRCWGPGRFRSALREAVAEGAVRRLPGGEHAPVHSPGERRASHPAER